jgi:hypothetical protein
VALQRTKEIRYFKDYGKKKEMWPERIVASKKTQRTPIAILIDERTKT